LRFDGLEEAHYFLTVKPSLLEKRLPEQLGAGAVALRQYAFYLQRLYNEEFRKARLAEHRVRQIIRPNLRQTFGYSWDERRLCAIAEDDAAQKADEERIEAQGRVDQLSFLVNRITELAHSLEELQQSKRRKV
jgi:hypothetical protein